MASAKMKEAERAKHQSTIQQGPPRFQVIHRVFCAGTEERVMYLEQPWTVNAGRGRSHLRGGQQVANMGLYLERNKDVCFLVLREYQCCGEKSNPTHRHRHGKETEIGPASLLVSERIDIVSDDLNYRLARLSDVALQGIPHPAFSRDEDDEDEIVDGGDYESIDYGSKDNSDVHYPYLWFYHRRPKISEAIDRLEEIDQEHLNVFCGYIRNRMSDEWAAVDNLISKGEITAEHTRYIYVSLLTRLVGLSSDH